MPISFSRRAVLLASMVVIAGAAACKDNTVPYLSGPTSVSNTPVGVQQAITGLFFAARIDVGNYVIISSSFSRDEANFTNTEPRWILEGLSIEPIPFNDAFISEYMFDQEFNNAKFANSILASLPHIVPAYATAQVDAITGVVQTMKALQFMMIAETRDTLGISVYSITASSPQPVYCNKDVWQYIVALLDSGNAALNAAGSIPLPVTLPNGFSSVSGFTSPSNALGSFASFNRALAGKAGLELAYAIARGGAGAPTPTTPGAPDATALTRADSAIKSSALFNVGAITTPTPGGFNISDPYTVYHSFSTQSSDLTNPIQGTNTLALMWDFVTDVDTINDARWKAKFSLNNQSVQQASFNAVASPYIYSYYGSPSSPIPIVRDEELALIDAQIQLGLGQLGNAITLINQVHQQAGGFGSPLAIPSDYIDVRNALLKEQRISTALEAGGDRNISIRMYGMPTVSDTTWIARNGPDSVGIATAEAALGTSITDQHTTVIPIPESEIDGRGGSYTVTCP
jgi:starch-binding outer membrane protein, SusD/RagB family